MSGTFSRSFSILPSEFLISAEFNLAQDTNSEILENPMVPPKRTQIMDGLLDSESVLFSFAVALRSFAL